LRLHPSDVAVVLVDGENVRRSDWPNLDAGELVRRCRRWAGSEHHVVVVFDGAAPELASDTGIAVVGSGERSADDLLVELAREQPSPLWLVTSDRELRRRVGDLADRVIGGGSFLGELSSAS
jgi:hypothetical protein